MAAGYRIQNVDQIPALEHRRAQETLDFVVESIHQILFYARKRNWIVLQKQLKN